MTRGSDYGKMILAKCGNIGARFREALLGLRRIICIHLLFIVVRARLVETLVTAVVCWGRFRGDILNSDLFIFIYAHFEIMPFVPDVATHKSEAFGKNVSLKTA